MITGDDLFKRTTLRSIERYVQDSLGNDFLTTVTDRQFMGGPEHFLREVRRQNGVTKLIPYIPKGLKLGVSRIFIAYFYTKELKPSYILGYFIAGGIEVIVPDDDIEQYREFASDPNVALIPEKYDSVLEREPGTIWITSRHNSRKMEADIDSSPSMFKEVVGGFGILAKPVKYNGDYFRNIAHFNPEKYSFPFGIQPPSNEAIEQRARKLLGVA